ncbi:MULTISPECIES: enhanced intracellular survival protein Eis [Micromonospora]|uniref:GNAT family N-acetyltransferase n=1 Tax=Micromonospora solifontis TaxID=2487138 RepID=A0ABX9WCG8_9ACTN|nr:MULTISPECIES: GNAT family N-acetyltransferase [Micromonospora]NES15771.1 GNAT family N-acetyltransferase [Micromonospora sp. PPF5-17B]NES38223.1 GNAT family N-acetyltransferase [Micromonospora solifontis]NES56617.1 GNAT family N-acetyltransferase [Micromonospora sp. PPF5-6]RNL96411.1 GNAT family N-acetyltransferase [Micromonospora solifontis]
MLIRRLAAEERLTTTFPLQAYAFEASPMAPSRVDEFREYLPYNAGNRTLVAEEDGGVTAAASAIPMRQNLRGSVLPMAGVAGVATHPLARRRGHVRNLLHRLLDEMRDEGHALTALYPFRASFYERFGYVGLPRRRTATFSPADLAPLLRADLPGEVTWQRIGAGYPTWCGYTERCLRERHGFAIFPDFRAVAQRDRDDRWLLTAVRDGATVGAVTYRIDDHGGTLLADDLLAEDPYARASLLQFFARHVDQVDRISVQLPADELPELWLTDLAVHVEARVSRPGSPAPMARLLSLDALADLPTGPGRVRVELVGDRWLAGSHLLDGATGKLEVLAGDSAAVGSVPTATLTAAGLSALAYGVLGPDDVVIRGLGEVPADAAVELRRIFPRELPYLFADF